MQLKTWDSEIFAKALFYAAHAHGTQQRESHGNVPYLVHVVGTAEAAINACFGKNVDWNLLVQVSLLHDVIEDTPRTYEDISLEFGQGVADGVLALSKDPSLPYEHRIADSLVRIKKQPEEIWIIKMADRMLNLQDIPEKWSQEKVDQYRKDAKLILNSLHTANVELAKRLADAINNYKVIQKR